MGVTFQQDDGVGAITLDHPPANSYDLSVMTEFSDAVDAAIGSGARAVVVRSASEKFFSAGADVKKFLDGDVDSNMEMIRTSQGAFRRMAAARQIFIAHINGHALGGGLEIALACDVRLATAGTQRLTRLLGPSRAMDLLLTGRTFSPEEALAWGLVAAVYEAENAVGEVRDYAARFAAGPALATAAIKRCVHDGGQQSLKDGLALEAELVERLFRSRDASEGLQAFVDKRAPDFVGS
jgi:enoyl-CoA hydratase/carnithine racemase